MSRRWHRTRHATSATVSPRSPPSMRRQHRALDAIKVDWEVLPAVFEPEDALEDAPLVHEVDWKGRDRKNNICKTVDLNFGDVEQALSESDVVVEGTWFYEGNTHAPIEPHCAVGT